MLALSLFVIAAGGAVKIYNWMLYRLFMQKVGENMAFPLYFQPMEQEVIWGILQCTFGLLLSFDINLHLEGVQLSVKLQ